MAIRVKVLVTGFGPYGGYSENPSGEAVGLLPEVAAKELPGLELVTAVLPVSFRRAREELLGLLDSERPDAYVGVGLGPGAAHLRIERVAVNLADARTPDEDGEQPVDEPIDPEGPAAYFSTLPVKAIVRRLREEGIPAALSYSAGTFLCNYVMYLGLHHSSRRGYPLRAGFVHVPLSHRQAASLGRDWSGIPPSMSVETVVRGLLVVLRVAVERFEAGDERVTV